MSNLKNHAERELKLAGFYDEDSDYGGMLPEAVLELIEVFSNQGHSGFSANIVRNLFNKLAAFEPILPITGKEEEWAQPHTGDETYQNKRLSSLFKEGKDGKPYYLNAIVFKGEEPHDTFTGKVEDIKSAQYVQLPFTPKTFYIDVVKKYNIEDYPDHAVVEGDTKYVYLIKDRKQLEEVFKYYNKRD